MNRRHPLPAEIYALVEQTPASVLLEDSSSSSVASPSRLFIDPLRVIEATSESEFPAIFEQIERATAQGHFAAGFFTYECGNYFEPAACIRPALPGQPLAWFGIYRHCYLFDHTTGAFVGGDPPLQSGFRKRAAYPYQTPADPDVILGLSEQEYSNRIDSIHEWIRAGDVYQLNFTFPMRTRWQGSPSALYARLRHRQPVAYGAFLHAQPGRHILSFSPELFFRVAQQGSASRIVTRPMKGTAPRGRTTAEDQQIAEWLRNDPKNRSENVMIVDLLRNDLGRLCSFGSVQVTSLFAIERHPTLWQLTSTISGELRPDVGHEAILRALFPCGSITGAPKVRAMQLLAQIEPEPRGIYTGAIGYFSRERSIFSVAIRTLELDGEEVKMGVGSGIVIDSQAAEEYRECRLKTEFLTRSEETFSLVETLIWQRGFPLIELHLDRLQDSASYFDFPFDRIATAAAIQVKAKSFNDRMPHKVRLLLNSEGGLHIEHEPMPAITARGRQPARVCFARQRIDPHDRFFFHKTTHRPVYAQAWKAAKDAGYDDVIFMNFDGQVTEGAISNIFIEHHRRWYTPPVECGLLPGVYRRHLLQTKATTHERILYPEDLKAADAVYLTNAVRGLRQVWIDWDREPI
jgi:para-aminobenzoate synthetase/4-amino-4-deoxychorismate lyase